MPAVETARIAHPVDRLRVEPSGKIAARCLGRVTAPCDKMVADGNSGHATYALGKIAGLIVAAPYKLNPVERDGNHEVDTVKKAVSGKFLRKPLPHSAHKHRATLIFGTVDYVVVDSFTVIMEISGSTIHGSRHCGKALMNHVEMVAVYVGARKVVGAMQTHHLLAGYKRTPTHLAYARIYKVNEPAKYLHIHHGAIRRAPSTHSPTQNRAAWQNGTPSKHLPDR